jgi:hypothetical protein
MQPPCTNAESRLLDAVRNVVALTDDAPTQSARQRLRGILGHRLYRTLVVRRTA